jgi:hypothetical protein
MAGKPQGFLDSLGAALWVLLKLTVRAATGQHLDGHRRSDATIWHDGTEAEPHHWSRNPWWPRLAGWKRAVVMFWVPGAAGWALLFHRGGTERVMAVVAGVLLGCALIRAALWWPEWGHYRSRVRPLHWKLAPLLALPPSTKPGDWLAIPPDYATNRDAEVVLYPPRDFTASDRNRDDVQRAVAVALPELEAPDFDFGALAGHKPRIIVKHSDPPPTLVTWDQIAPKVAAKAAHELVTGIGKHSEVIKVSVETDSPHFGISMGTGAGKSNLAAFWLVQRLRQGDIALILDAKHFSHPWAFKDMDAEYGLLPNVRYARWIPDLHEAMLWLGRELSSRTLAAERVINAKGDLLKDVGPRLWIVAEEMNLATPLLKQHWADVRDKEDVKKSPALTAFGGVAFAGRAVKMHLIVIGQQLTAETLGGGSVRENIGVRCLARYTQNSWKMQAGDVPMPPSPSVPGRVQCIASGGVSETQVPLMDLEQVRELAVGGTVTGCPLDMPGAASPAELPVPAPDAIHMSPDQPNVLGMTLAQAIAESVLRRSLESARKEAQRPGFPVPLNPEDGSGVAKRYRPSDLDAWEKEKVLR